VFSATARHDLTGIPPRIVLAVVEFIYGDLAAQPRRVGKPLERDLAGTFSARRGPYRILYELDDDLEVVQVLRIDHRAEATGQGDRLSP
jgi:mRNA-degrading endonuclease RelE of RelBE toxin-antitoxin system